jgi:hypothetical protein
MKLVIIAEDACVGIDSLSYGGLNMAQLDPTIHAVQWNGEYGEVEYKSRFENGQMVKPQNQIITSIASYQWAIDLWTATKVSEEAAILEAVKAAEQAAMLKAGSVK